MQIPGPDPVGSWVLTSSQELTHLFPALCQLVSRWQLKLAVVRTLTPENQPTPQIRAFFFFFKRELVADLPLPQTYWIRSSGEKGPKHPCLLSCRPGDSAALRTFCNHHRFRNSLDPQASLASSKPLSLLHPQSPQPPCPLTVPLPEGKMLQLLPYLMKQKPRAGLERALI